MKCDNEKRNNKSKNSKLVTVFIVIVLIVSSTIVYNFFIKNSEEVEELKEEVKEIDDQISPLENQGLTIEILRMRHRGLYEKVTKFGNSWKTKPKFYFETDMDEVVYTSNKVGQHGKFEETYFNTWDTMFQENKIVLDAVEEQETSTVKLTIYEVITTGLVFKKSKSVERESITLRYDYRTGRWSGSDYFDDEDGYGHYLGDTFEIWFNLYQMDYDDDFIPYWIEVNVLGTDPRRDDSKLDPDGDGCPTSWEWKWGYDPFVWDDHDLLDPDVDGLDNIEEYEMAQWFSNPFYKDVYVEVDYVEGNGIFDPPSTFYVESQQAIIEKYAEHHISLYFDTGWSNGPKNGGGQLLPYWEKLSQDSGMILQYYNNYFPPERRGIFRYLVIGHSGGYNHPAKNNVYDCTYVVHDPLVYLKPFKIIKNFIKFGTVGTIRGKRIQLAAITMHELGHSIGIGVSPFEGVDNTSYGIPRFPNKSYKYVAYRSVMNYQCIYDENVLDYSDGSNGPPYDQNDWEKIFIPHFQLNDALIEDPSFEPPGHDKYIYNETEVQVTGYVFDENLTQDFIETIGDYSPVDPIKVNWKVFRLKEKDNYPNYKDVKILVQPIVPYAEFVHYGEGDLNKEGKMEFYSQQELIDNLISNIQK